MGLVDALQNGTVKSYGKTENVKITLGDGNAQIDVKGSKVSIETGVGNQKVAVVGDDVDITLDKNAPIDWDSSADFDDVIVSATKKANVNTGDGNDTAFVSADKVDVKMGDASSYHDVVVWGKDGNVNVGDAGQLNSVRTLDKMISDGDLESYSKEFGTIFGEEALTEATNKMQADSTKLEDIQVGSKIISITDNYEELLNDLDEKYHLDDKQKNEIKRLFDSGELFDTLADGVTPKYAILASSDTARSTNGNTYYCIAKIDSYNADTGYIHAWGYGYDSNGSKKETNTYKDCIKTYTKGENANKLSTEERYETSKTVVREVTTKEQYQVNGFDKLTIKTGDAGQQYIKATVTGELVKDIGDTTNPKKTSVVETNGAYIVAGKTKSNLVETQEGQVIANLMTATGTTKQSPLVVDFDGDGKVEAGRFTGVDLNGDGIADGGAIGGDKMLAMSDINGNGQIDANEVFGDQTVSPFTGKALNATNGFEALKMVAQEAEQYTGIKCYSNGQVDLQALKTALASVGSNLGFISDDNVTNLEDLAHIKAINVDEYETKESDDDVEHRQQGTAVTTDGTTVKTDDVWFKKASIREKLNQYRV